MEKNFVYYQDGKIFIGWLEEFPDYKTQGESLAELMENLKDIHVELTGGAKSGPPHLGKKPTFDRPLPTFMCVHPV